jgi:hypothetical protein
VVRGRSGSSCGPEERRRWSFALDCCRPWSNVKGFFLWCWCFFFFDVGVCVVFGEVALLLSGEVMLTWRIWWGISSGL